MPPLPPTTSLDPYERLMELIHRYTTFTTLPDLDRFQRIVSSDNRHCAFKECTEPVVWEDNRGGFYLCEGHYRTLKSWIEEARKEYL